MATMKEIALAINAYAPGLDEVEKVKFGMFIHNEFAREEDLRGLNLPNMWRKYNEEVSA